MRIPLFSWLFFVPICSIFLTFSIHVVSGHCLDDQKSFLKFNTTLSTKLVHWNVARDCCSWEGVTCSNESFSKGHVIGLNLNNESIYVGLDYSSSLFSLQHLQDLSLANNNFNNSQIPPGFGNLMNLSYLNLSNAGFLGQIPVEISNLKRLVTLDLSTSPFLSVSMLKIENPDLAMLVRNFSELKELYLDGVNISASGNEWCRALSSSLPNLSVLSMSDCYLSGPLDSSLLKLQSLSIIRLNNNPLNAPISEFFANFTNLTSLGLRFCGLNGTFPEKIFLVPTLQTLDLSYNDLLQGSLPEFLPNGSLRSLLLSGTIFSGALPDSIGNLKRLSKIDLSTCNFNGSIPNSMANLTQLIYLDMSYNKFNGQIPSFSMAKNLTEINLSFNDLGGGINSTRWEELINLVNLDLGYNSIEGSIPMSLFSHPSIQKLQLSNNKFSGGLQEFNVSSYPLDHLDLSSNNLEGPLPASVFKLQGLNFLSFSFNNFSGSFQLDGIQKLRNLSEIDLSYNKLSINYNGTASPLLFPYFTTFKLASCNLGKFPDFLRNQSTLNNLDLSQNQIHGEIPNWIWQLNSLMYLNLSHNHFLTLQQEPSQNLPSQLSVLDLHSNKLQGQLPHLPPLVTYLDFSKNNFSSVIPTSIGISLNSTIFLSLSSNKFHGDIPQSLCNGAYLRFPKKSSPTWTAMMANEGEVKSKLNHLQFRFLHFGQFYYQDMITVTTKGLELELVSILSIFTSIDVSCNQLDGPIPEEIAALKSLYSLNISHNAFSGQIPLSLGNLTQLESLDLSSNNLTGEIPMQLADLTFLAVLNLSFNKLVGRIPQGKQFATFSENSFEGNRGLCGDSLNKKCAAATGPRSPLPKFEETHLNPGIVIDWNVVSAELGFVFGLGIVIGPLMFWKRWRIWYYKHVDDILFSIFPQLYLGKEYHQSRAQ
ncbi:receptor-like protein cf-9 like protein [Quercus suber]|uniref:Receptor-like protein cf-9 like protein n=1 Tax=Quercus suber TaxID=58331 RepID=A0AAW0MAN6_QUESU